MVFTSRLGELIVGRLEMWLRIAKLGDLPADITPHTLRHSFASLAPDLGFSEPTIASLLGHKTHSVTSRYMNSADAVLLAAAEAVASATTKLMAQVDLDLTRIRLLWFGSERASPACSLRMSSESGIRTHCQPDWIRV
jgi:hypothetical protein